MNMRILFPALLPITILVLAFSLIYGCDSKPHEVVKTIDQIRQDSIDKKIQFFKDSIQYKKIGTYKTYDVDNQGRDIYVITIDSCEYIGDLSGSYSDILTHKGNCKYCEARRKARENKNNFPDKKVKDSVSIQ